MARASRFWLGPQPHRFIKIWAVVVERRVFVRSWSLKSRSWYRTFLKEPRGAIQIAGREITVRAYLKKFGAGGLARFARDLCRAESRATTTELVPL